MDEEDDLLFALMLMVDQYLSREGEELDNMCMSAGEHALEALVARGLATWGSSGFRFATWTKRGRDLLDAQAARPWAQMGARVATREG